MGFLDWIKDKIAEDQFNLEDKQGCVPLDESLKYDLKSFIDQNYVIPYSNRRNDNALFGNEFNSREFFKGMPVTEMPSVMPSIKPKTDLKEIKTDVQGQSTIPARDSDVRYSLPSTDDMEGLSRQAEAFASNNNQYVDATSFTDSLRMLVIKSGLDNADIYKRANLSKSVFSSIFANEHIPKKGTVVALAIALELNLEETERLLMKAGYTFSNSIKADLIAVYFINHKIYDIDKLNAALYEYGEPILGSKSF